MCPINQGSIWMPLPPSTTPPPLPRSAPPPHPVPELPPGLKLDVKAPAPPQPDLEKKVALWRERTRIIAESVLAYESFQIQEEEYNKAVKAMESPFFVTLPDAEKMRLAAQVDALLSRRNAFHEKYEKLQDRLTHSSSWPIAPIEEADKHLALVRDIIELRDAVLRVKDALGDLGEISKPPPQLGLFLSANDSDEEENQYPNRKTQQSHNLAHDAQPPHPAKDMPTQKELEEYHNKLVVCQEQLANLWNHCHQRNVNQHQDFERELQDRIEKVQQQRAKEQQKREREREKQKAAKQAASKEMDQQVSRDGDDLATITTDMASMLLTVEKLQVELQQETQARNQSFQKMLQVEQRLNSYVVAQQADTATLKSLQAALKTYTTPPSPAMSPKVFLPSYLLETFEQPLVESLRLSIRPVLEELRTDVEMLVKEKNGQLFATVWEKISQTLMVLNLIHKRLDAARFTSQSQVQ